VLVAVVILIGSRERLIITGGFPQPQIAAPLAVADGGCGSWISRSLPPKDLVQSGVSRLCESDVRAIV